jgi:hypothetical protein
VIPRWLVLAVLFAGCIGEAAADTVTLRPYLRPDRLAAIEAALAPAKPFIRSAANNPTPLIRGWITAVSPDTSSADFSVEMRAWWRESPTSPIVSSRGTVTLRRNEITNVRFESDGLLGLRFLYGARAADGQFFDGRLRAYDADGRLGLANGVAAGVEAVPGFLARWQHELLALTTPGGKTPFDVLSPFEQMQIPGTPPSDLLAGITFDRVHGPFEQGYRDAAVDAFASLTFLVRTSLRTEFLGAAPPSAAALPPPSEQLAANVSGLGYGAQSVAFSALDLSNPAAVADDRDVEPSDTAFVALELIESLPTFSVPLATPRETVALASLGALLRVGTPFWAKDHTTDDARLGDRRQYGTAARAAGFAPPRGSWTPVQVAARRAMLKLLLPDREHPLVAHYGLENDLLEAASMHQQAFCSYLTTDEADGMALFIERTYVEAAQAGTPVDVPCLEHIFENLGTDGSLDLEFARTKGRAYLPTLLIVGALVSGGDALVPGTELGANFDRTLDVWLEGTTQGRSNLSEVRSLQLIAAAGGYLFPDTRENHYDEAQARTAVAKAIGTARAALQTSAGDAAHLAIRDLAERAVATTQFAPSPYDRLR